MWVTLEGHVLLVAGHCVRGDWNTDMYRNYIRGGYIFWSSLVADDKSKPFVFLQ